MPMVPDIVNEPPNNESPSHCVIHPSIHQTVSKCRPFQPSWAASVAAMSNPTNQHSKPHRFQMQPLQGPPADCHRNTITGVNPLKGGEHPVGLPPCQPKPPILATAPTCTCHMDLLMLSKGPHSTQEADDMYTMVLPQFQYIRGTAWFRWFCPKYRVEDRPCP